jgi:replicative DNA helicase
MTVQPATFDDFTQYSNIDAEKALLGALLYNDQITEDVLEILASGDLFMLRHQHILAAAERLHAARKPVDTQTVGDELSRVGHLEAVGGYVYLAELMNSVSYSHNAVYYALSIKEMAIRRNGMKAADEIKRLYADRSADIEAVAARAEQLVTTASDIAGGVDRSVSMDTALERQWNEIEDVTNGAAVPSRIPNRHADGRGIIRGWVDGALYTIAARPGVGKSSFATCEAVHIAQHLQANAPGQRVVIYSLEMAEREVTNAIVALEALIPYTALDDRILTPDDQRKYVAAAGRIGKLPIDIVDDLTCYEDIAADIKARHRRGEFGTAFIDQLSLLDTRMQFRGDGLDRQRINYVMPKMKRLAMTIGAPLFNIHQVNREGDDEPKLKYLKDSGKVEESSDAVIFIHRDMDEAAGDNPPEIQTAKIIVAKNRHGKMGRFIVGFHGKYKAFVSLSRAAQNGRH